LQQADISSSNVIDPIYKVNFAIFLLNLREINPFHLSTILIGLWS